jgi:hypothetical protein
MIFTTKLSDKKRVIFVLTKKEGHWQNVKKKETDKKYKLRRNCLAGWGRGSGFLTKKRLLGEK